MNKDLYRKLMETQRGVQKRYQKILCYQRYNKETNIIVSIIKRLFGEHITSKVIIMRKSVDHQVYRIQCSKNDEESFYGKVLGSLTKNIKGNFSDLYKKMSKAIALMIGVNSLDLQHYGGWSGELSAAESTKLEK